MPVPRPNELLQQITRRAERLDPRQQAATFVSIGGLEHTLLNPDHRVIFGRRGTGKTHLMSFVAERARKKGELAIQLDLRTIGSNSYIYQDATIAVSERATRLVRDFLSALHLAIMDWVTEPNNNISLANLSGILERLSEAVTETVVRDEHERKLTDHGGNKFAANGEIEGKAAGLLSSLKGKGKLSSELEKDHTSEVTEKAHFRLSLSIGSAHRAISELTDILGRRIWILIDEWSTVPQVLQPFLADFIKRGLLPHRNISVHIAAIEQRTQFREGDGAESFGIEVGSDIFADVNLDDHLVFENSPESSIDFFKQLLFRHLIAVIEDKKAFKSADEFVGTAFTQGPTFREAVRACEGVPRDFINILQLAATKAKEEKISMIHIRNAAKDWYDRDKALYVNNNSEANALLHWIIREVIGIRKARAFMLRSDVRNSIMDRLFDERILHIAKKSYSAKAEPGIRYKVWKLDFGCYVDLINTAHAPTGYLAEDHDIDGWSQSAVPEDDLRAIRRAILDLANFKDREEA